MAQIGLSIGKGNEVFGLHPQKQLHDIHNPEVQVFPIFEGLFIFHPGAVFELVVGQLNFQDRWLGFEGLESQLGDGLVESFDAGDLYICVELFIGGLHPCNILIIPLIYYPDKLDCEFE